MLGTAIKKPKRGNHKGQTLEARSRGTDTSNLSAAEMAELIPPDKPLTDKQKLFAEHWAKGDSIASAALRAGYSESSASVGHRLAKMPNVLAAKARHHEKFESDNQMSRQTVMAGIKEAIDMAKLMAEPASMIAGWREVGKMCGYYAPVEHKMKVDVTGNIILDRMNSMSDAELLKVISQGASNASAPALSHVQESSDAEDDE